MVPLLQHGPPALVAGHERTRRAVRLTARFACESSGSLLKVFAFALSLARNPRCASAFEVIVATQWHWPTGPRSVRSVVLAYFARPVLHRDSEGFCDVGRRRTKWKTLDEHVTYAIVEDATLNAIFTKYHQGKLEPKQNPGLKIVPRRWKGYVSRGRG